MISIFRTVLLERWVYHRSDSIKAKLSKLPSIVLWEIGRRTNKMAYAQGIGRHAQPEVDRILSEDMKALSEFLGLCRFSIFTYDNSACITFKRIPESVLF